MYGSHYVLRFVRYLRLGCCRLLRVARSLHTYGLRGSRTSAFYTAVLGCVRLLRIHHTHTTHHTCGCPTTFSARLHALPDFRGYVWVGLRVCLRVLLDTVSAVRFCHCRVHVCTRLVRCLPLRLHHTCAVPQVWIHHLYGFFAVTTDSPIATFCSFARLPRAHAHGLRVTPHHYNDSHYRHHTFVPLHAVAHRFCSATTLYLAVLLLRFTCTRSRTLHLRLVLHRISTLVGFRCRFFFFFFFFFFLRRDLDSRFHTYHTTGFGLVTGYILVTVHGLPPTGSTHLPYYTVAGSSHVLLRCTVLLMVWVAIRYVWVQLRSFLVAGLPYPSTVLYRAPRGYCTLRRMVCILVATHATLSFLDFGLLLCGLPVTVLTVTTLPTYTGYTTQFYVRLLHTARLPFYCGLPALFRTLRVHALLFTHHSTYLRSTLVLPRFTQFHNAATGFPRTTFSRFCGYTRGLPPAPHRATTLLPVRARSRGSRFWDYMPGSTQFCTHVAFHAAFLPLHTPAFPRFGYTRLAFATPLPFTRRAVRFALRTHAPFTLHHVRIHGFALPVTATTVGWFYHIRCLVLGYWFTFSSSHVYLHLHTALPYRLVLLVATFGSAHGYTFHRFAHAFMVGSTLAHLCTPAVCGFRTFTLTRLHTCRYLHAALPLGYRFAFLTLPGSHARLFGSPLLRFCRLLFSTRFTRSRRTCHRCHARHLRSRTFFLQFSSTTVGYGCTRFATVLYTAAFGSHCARSAFVRCAGYAVAVLGSWVLLLPDSLPTIPVMVTCTGLHYHAFSYRFVRTLPHTTTLHTTLPHHTPTLFWVRLPRLRAVRLVYTTALPLLVYVLRFARSGCRYRCHFTGLRLRLPTVPHYRSVRLRARSFLGCVCVYTDTHTGCTLVTFLRFAVLRGCARFGFCHVAVHRLVLLVPLRFGYFGLLRWFYHILRFAFTARLRLRFGLPHAYVTCVCVCGSHILLLARGLPHRGCRTAGLHFTTVTGYGSGCHAHTYTHARPHHHTAPFYAGCVCSSPRPTRFTHLHTQFCTRFTHAHTLPPPIPLGSHGLLPTVIPTVTLPRSLRSAVGCVWILLYRVARFWILRLRCGCAPTVPVVTRCLHTALRGCRTVPHAFLATRGSHTVTLPLRTRSSAAVVPDWVLPTSYTPTTVHTGLYHTTGSALCCGSPGSCRTPPAVAHHRYTVLPPHGLPTVPSPRVYGLLRVRAGSAFAVSSVACHLHSFHARLRVPQLQVGFLARSCRARATTAPRSSFAHYRTAYRLHTHRFAVRTVYAYRLFALTHLRLRSRWVAHLRFAVLPLRFTHTHTFTLPATVLLHAVAFGSFTGSRLRWLPHTTRVGSVLCHLDSHGSTRLPLRSSRVPFTTPFYYLILFWIRSPRFTPLPAFTRSGYRLHVAARTFYRGSHILVWFRYWVATHVYGSHYRSAILCCSRSFHCTHAPAVLHRCAVVTIFAGCRVCIYLRFAVYRLHARTTPTHTATHLRHAARTYTLPRTHRLHLHTLHRWMGCGLPLRTYVHACRVTFAPRSSALVCLCTRLGSHATLLYTAAYLHRVHVLRSGFSPAFSGFLPVLGSPGSHSDYYAPFTPRFVHFLVWLPLQFTHHHARFTTAAFVSRMRSHTLRCVTEFFTGSYPCVTVTFCWFVCGYAPHHVLLARCVALHAPFAVHGYIYLDYVLRLRCSPPFACGYARAAFGYSTLPHVGSTVIVPFAPVPRSRGFTFVWILPHAPYPTSYLPVGCRFACAAHRLLLPLFLHRTHTTRLPPRSYRFAHSSSSWFTPPARCHYCHGCRCVPATPLHLTHARRLPAPTRSLFTAFTRLYAYTCADYDFFFFFFFFFARTRSSLTAVVRLYRVLVLGLRWFFTTRLDHYTAVYATPLRLHGCGSRNTTLLHTGSVAFTTCGCWLVWFRSVAAHTGCLRSGYSSFHVPRYAVPVPGYGCRFVYHFTLVPTDTTTVGLRPHCYRAGWFWMRLRYRVHVCYRLHRFYTFGFILPVTRFTAVTLPTTFTTFIRSFYYHFTRCHVPYVHVLHCLLLGSTYPVLRYRVPGSHTRIYNIYI